MKAVQAIIIIIGASVISISAFIMILEYRERQRSYQYQEVLAVAESGQMNTYNKGMVRQMAIIYSGNTITLLYSDGERIELDRDDFEKSLDLFYEIRGWDSEGKPTEETLAHLGIEDIII